MISMNDECIYRRVFLLLQSVYKYKQACLLCILLIFVFEELLLLSIRYFFFTVICYCLFYFFILTLLPYFCLFVNHVNKLIIFVFGFCYNFVYNFKNTTSIFVTICLLNLWCFLFYQIICILFKKCNFVFVS